MDRARASVAIIGLVAGVAAGWTMLGNDVRPRAAPDVALVLAVGWSFLVSGLVAWRLRPGNPIGRAMVVMGLLRFVQASVWSQDPVVFTLGHAFAYLYMAGIVYVLLAFPNGRLERPAHRIVFGLAVVATGPIQVAWLLVGGPEQAGSCAACPSNLLRVMDAPDLASATELAQLTVGAIAGALAVVMLGQRWRSASAPLRLAISPVIWTGAGTSGLVIGMILNHLAGEPLGGLPHLGLDVSLALVAVAFLVGVARTRMARSGVAELLTELARGTGPEGLRAALARALRDPSLEVAYWLPAEGRFVDSSGQPVRLPRPGDLRAATIVQREGRRIAALVHDPAVTDDESLIRAVAAAAGLQLENQRLQADLRAQLEELRASRARIVEATQEERRRIERDLHDGTQQRLVSIAMLLGLLDSKVATDPTEARRLIAEARSGLAAALDELRELSQGIHPGILTERGLGTAIDELALRMHVPVEVDVRLSERLPTRVETAAYYVIAEALTNVAKHACAKHVRVGLGRADGHALIAVSDDGRGGAEAGGGSGLRGLRDRVEALGGSFGFESPVGSGTIIRAEIPCE